MTTPKTPASRVATDTPPADLQKPAGRRPYEPPALVRRGDVRTLTMGASPGTGDSGAPFTYKPPGT